MTNVISSNSTKTNAGSNSNSSKNTHYCATITATTNNNDDASNNNVPNLTTKKPKQSKKASNTMNSQISTPQNGNISTNRSDMNTINKVQQRIMQSLLITTNQNIPLQTMNIGQGNMNPSNTLGITPTTNNLSTTPILILLLIPVLQYYHQPMF